VRCDVWWARPVDPASAPRLVALLDAHERERLARFRRPADTARYLAAHALTRLVLADLLGRDAASLAFDRTCRCGKQHGKPVLVGDDVPGFSFTHGGELVGVAVHAGGPVGLDVEQVRELADLDAMSAHVYSPTEPPPARPEDFFVTWTRKEALLKATGAGLSAPMSSITLGRRGVASWTGDGAPNRSAWVRDLSPAEGYRAAVAGLGAAPSIVEADGNALLS
jgi:4'-phosphopantetheinyl transferase